MRAIDILVAAVGIRNERGKMIRHNDRFDVKGAKNG